MGSGALKVTRCAAVGTDPWLVGRRNSIRWDFPRSQQCSGQMVSPVRQRLSNWYVCTPLKYLHTILISIQSNESLRHILKEQELVWASSHFISYSFDNVKVKFLTPLLIWTGVIHPACIPSHVQAASVKECSSPALSPSLLRSCHCSQFLPTHFNHRQKEPGSWDADHAGGQSHILATAATNTMTTATDTNSTSIANKWIEYFGKDWQCAE